MDQENKKQESSDVSGDTDADTQPQVSEEAIVETDASIRVPPSKELSGDEANHRNIVKDKQLDASQSHVEKSESNIALDNRHSNILQDRPDKTNASINSVLEDESSEVSTEYIKVETLPSSPTTDPKEVTEDSSSSNPETEKRHAASDIKMQSKNVVAQGKDYEDSTNDNNDLCNNSNQNCVIKQEYEKAMIDESSNKDKLKKSDSGLPESSNTAIKVECTEKTAEKDVTEQPIVTVMTASEESISQVNRDEIIEHTTETIEYSVIEYEEGVTEPVVANSEAIEIIVESEEANESVPDSLVVLEVPAPVSIGTIDKEVSQSNGLSTINNELETCVSENVDSRENTEKLKEESREESNEEKSIENGKLGCLKKSDAKPASNEVNSDKNIDLSSSEKPESSTAPGVKLRSVIQDIFDDWRDENPEEECQLLSKPQDSVEMELQILLDDDKSVERHSEDITAIAERPTSVGMQSLGNLDSTGSKMTIVESEDSTVIVEDLQRAIDSPLSTNSEKLKESTPVKEGITDQVGSRKTGKTSATSVGRERVIRQKPLAPRPGVKVPGLILTSPIVSKTAVSQVLKERLREQQKPFNSPAKPDIFFVKKITQRLSHKLAAASAAQLPGLVPLPSDVSTNSNANKIAKKPTTSEPKKTSSVDKELLAILEGDVDPDWSNLKPPTLVEESKTCSIPMVEHNSPPKLDPLVERELALKQLLELPSSPVRKNAAKKMTTTSVTPITPKPTRNKTVPKPSVAKTSTSRAGTKKDVSVEPPEVKSETTTIVSIEKDDIVLADTSAQDLKVDETRSGRKRKPTEKAREHEQNSTKRLKVVKGKLLDNKRTKQESNQSLIDSPVINKIDDAINSVTESTGEEIEIDTDSKRTIEKTVIDPVVAPTVTDDSDKVEPKLITPEVVRKKVTPRPSAKRKLPGGQARLRQNISPNKKKIVEVKSIFSKSIPKKTASKVTGSKGQKRNGEPIIGEVKAKKKVIDEIDRLLQDEGVVNLLYDVEQPGKKRLVPITKSQTKVMDIQKVKRELKIRTKLVRNAVLRLRTSNVATGKVSQRSKRSVSNTSDGRPEKKSGDQTKSGQSSATSPTDFIYPAKIRNAADASIIIRRHSSSSFSSASGSPRVSIDAPDRLLLDGGRPVDSGAVSHVLRSKKRRYSQEDDKKKQPSESKRNRRRITERLEAEEKNIDAETVIPAVSATKNNKSNVGVGAVAVATTARSSKKVDAKKNPKSLKQQQQQQQQQHVEVIDVDENSSNGTSNSKGKVLTRSNGLAGGGKIMPKSKKSIKCKVTFAKGIESFKRLDGTGQEDELSACLAEAVTALSNDSGGPSRSRSTIPVNRNKPKGNLSSAKSSDISGTKLKLDPKVQFSNNEINVQRHGNLVQLLLTPSTTTKMRNGITLQIMQELRETLSILKKDEECRVVLLTSTGSSFCEGLELSTLLHDDKDERRLRAEELANGVKEFIKSLATFNKPIVAGVQGSAVGLGVTMLPWFDLVIASDKATFSTPYGKLGQIAEGAAIFTLSHILGSAVTSELLLGGRTLTANEALRAGLVSRVLWPDRFQAELLPSLRAMSEQSSQSMEATKALLRHSLRKKLDAALESESYLLIQHWCSAECQTAIKSYIDEKIQ